MTSVTPQEKRYLKSLGQTLKDHAVVSPGEFSEGHLATLQETLARYELIKVRMTTVEGAARKAFASEIAERLDALCVGVVGRTTLLYRFNPELPRAKHVLK